MRVIFDRSTFHGDRFQSIEKSPLRHLVARNRIVVMHTPIFLEETLATYGSNRAGNYWRKQLAFALDICNGGFFLDKEQIWRYELVSGRGPFSRYLLPERPNRTCGSAPQLIETLREKIATGDLSREWAESATERTITQQKKTNQKNISREIREEVSTAIRERGVKGRVADYSFAQFRKSEFLRTGHQLMNLVDSRRAGPLANQWAQRPMEFPFYSAFVEGFLYYGYHAAVKHNEKIDRNAQADYEQLAYLTWADLIVSDDEGFFRSAFDDIWRPRGKRLQSSQSFVEFLQRCM